MKSHNSFDLIANPAPPHRRAREARRDELAARVAESGEQGGEGRHGAQVQGVEGTNPRLAPPRWLVFHGPILPARPTLSIRSDACPFPPPVLSAQGGKGKKVPPPAPPTKNKAAVKAAAANLNAANLPGADLLEELAARFVLNCPEEELNSFERILFLVEQAHWYYEDFVREEKPHLKGMRLREFAELMFNKCASLRALPREG